MGDPTSTKKGSLADGPSFSKRSESYLCDHPHWCSRDRPPRHDGGLHPSFRGLYRLGFESGLCHAYRSRARDGRLCEGSSHLCHGEVEMPIGDEESDHDDCLDHGHHPVRHGRSQTARMRKEAYGPTKLPLVLLERGLLVGRFVPQSSRHHLVQDACCASHDRHHLHHGDSRIRRKRTCWRCKHPQNFQCSHSAMTERHTVYLQRFVEPVYRSAQGVHS